MSKEALIAELQAIPGLAEWTHCIVPESFSDTRYIHYFTYKLNGKISGFTAMAVEVESHAFEKLISHIKNKLVKPCMHDAL